ncbi:MAG: hypothetical protein Q8P91_00560 [bacterium]|nr:hypothetical protein [bacterium]
MVERRVLNRDVVIETRNIARNLIDSIQHLGEIDIDGQPTSFALVSFRATLPEFKEFEERVKDHQAAVIGLGAADVLSDDFVVVSRSRIEDDCYDTVGVFHDGKLYSGVLITTSLRSVA